MLSLLMFLLFLLFTAFNMPICVAMGLPALIVFLLSGESLISIPQNIAMGVNSYPLMAVPFFILAGNVMNYTGLTARICLFANRVVGHLPGGLAQVCVFANMIFAGVSGTAVADCAGLGTVQMKAMTEAGYRKPFSAAVNVAAACIGPIIPPSLVMVIYAVEANASVARMFLGGVVPGILMGLTLMAYIVYLVRSGKEECPRLPRSSFLGILKAFRDSFFAVISPFVILWALVSGVATPTEAGIIATVYAVFTGIFYGDFRWKDVPKILEESVLLTALIMFIVAMATLMGHVMTMERAPQMLAKFVLALTTNKYLLLFLIIMFLLFLGSLLEGMPILIIMTPILIPIVEGAGIDIVHFGVMMCFAITLGIITPPMAIGIVILVGISGSSFEDIARSAVKFLIPLVLTLFLVAYIPDLVLFLPDLLLGK